MLHCPLSVLRAPAAQRYTRPGAAGGHDWATRIAGGAGGARARNTTACPKSMAQSANVPHTDALVAVSQELDLQLELDLNLRTCPHRCAGCQVSSFKFQVSSFKFLVSSPHRCAGCGPRESSRRVSSGCSCHQVQVRAQVQVEIQIQISTSVSSGCSCQGQVSSSSSSSN